jgi:NDP-sugar pyrophosphorylase family protein
MLAAPVLVGPGSRVEAGVRLGPGAVVGSGCRVRAGSSVERAVLWAGTALWPGERVAGAIAAGDHRIAAT